VSISESEYRINKVKNELDAISLLNEDKRVKVKVAQLVIQLIQLESLLCTNVNTAKGS